MGDRVCIREEFFRFRLAATGEIITAWTFYYSDGTTECVKKREKIKDESVN